MVKIGNQPVLNAIEKLTKSNDLLQQAADAAVMVANQNSSFEGTVNLQYTQFEDRRKVAETINMFDGFLEFLGADEVVFVCELKR